LFNAHAHAQTIYPTVIVVLVFFEKSINFAETNPKSPSRVQIPAITITSMINAALTAMTILGQNLSPVSSSSGGEFQNSWEAEEDN